MRKNWDEYFIDIMNTVASRATCDRGRSGAIIVKDKRILATGYVGSPPGLKHCDDIGHLLKISYDENENKKVNCVRTAHAEQNAIAQAAKYGIPIDGATIYCRMEPCIDCAKLIMGVGIKRVVCEKRYHAADLTREWFKESGVELIVLNDEFEKYENQ